MTQPIDVRYRNYRGETSVRRVRPLHEENPIEWGSTEHHPEEQWLLHVWDEDKNAHRTYALKDCDFAYEATNAVVTDLAASLAAAISLLEKGGKAAKKAAPSDKMFDQMLVDYRASLERGRAFIKGT